MCQTLLYMGGKLCNAISKLPLKCKQGQKVLFSKPLLRFEKYEALKTCTSFYKYVKYRQKNYVSLLSEAIYLVTKVLGPVSPMILDGILRYGAHFKVLIGIGTLYEIFSIIAHTVTERQAHFEEVAIWSKSNSSALANPLS